MGTAKDKLLQCLRQAQGTEEWEHALEAVKYVFEWALEVATPDQVFAGANEAERWGRALAVLVLMHNGLQEAVQYLDKSLSGFIGPASAGDDLRKKLSGYQARLAQLEAEIPKKKEQLAQLAQLEQELEKQLEEERLLKQRLEEQQRALESRRVELERLRQLALDPKAIEVLQREVQELETQMPPGWEEVRQFEATLGARLERLVVTLNEYVALLSAEVQGALRRIDEKRQELSRLLDDLRKAKAELEEAEERYRQVQREFQGIQQELELYLKADQLVAQALPNARQPLDLLREAERLVQEAERILKTAIERNEAQAMRKELFVV